jgi:glycerol-3-phosphate responsive antiterminator
MTRRSLLDDVVVEKARYNLDKLGNYGVIASKLKAIISAGTHGITLTAEVFDINRKTLTSWIKEVKNDKVDNLNSGKFCS